MCILAYAETRKLSKIEFDNCWKTNDDGAGFSWRKDGVNHYVKGFMSKEEAWEAYQKIEVLPHVAHFRLTSTGTKTSDLTHPFVISQDSPVSTAWEGTESLLFHNGTVSDWERFGMSHFLSIGYIPEGEMSDTRVAAMIVAKLGQKALKFMSGKFILWDKDIATLFGKFTEEKGVFFSNSSYESYSWSSNNSWDNKSWNNDWLGSSVTINRSDKKKKKSKGTVTVPCPVCGSLDAIEYDSNGFPSIYCVTCQSSSYAEEDEILNHDVDGYKEGEDPCPLCHSTHTDTYYYLGKTVVFCEDCDEEHYLTQDQQSNDFSLSPESGTDEICTCPVGNNQAFDEDSGRWYCCDCTKFLL